MTLRGQLPSHVIELMASGFIAEYATISAAGVPIDTPALYFPSEELRSFDLATGLAYPAKAERARRNPKVGLLIEGGPEEPVISIAGMAAVRDANLQANAERYIAEAGHTLPGNPDWSLARQAVWYWTRIIIEVTPAQILWWDSPAAMEGPPQGWRAADDTVYPRSDPAPPGEPSSASKWEQLPWQELAKRALDRGGHPHFSVVCEQGFPRPIRVRAVALHRDGFTLSLPKGLPWSIAGKACLTFRGIETFIGEIVASDEEVLMRVQRTLPIFPMTADMSQLWRPTDHTRESLMRRLEHEVRRRGQPIPSIPLQLPEPTEGYRLRLARQRRLAGR